MNIARQKFDLNHLHFEKIYILPDRFVDRMIINGIEIERDHFVMLVMNNAGLYDEKKLFVHVDYFYLMIDIVLKHSVAVNDLWVIVTDSEMMMMVMMMIMIKYCI